MAVFDFYMNSLFICYSSYLIVGAQLMQLAIYRPNPSSLYRFCVLNYLLNLEDVMQNLILCIFFARVCGPKLNFFTGFISIMYSLTGIQIQVYRLRTV